MKLAHAFLLLCLVLVPAITVAQTDIELAEYYYTNGEYEQAKLYYEKIYKSNKSNKVYDKYLNTLVALGEFEEAERMVKKKIRSRGNNANAFVDLGELYVKFGKIDQAHEQFDKAIDELLPGRSNGIRLANAFIKMAEYDYAYQSYVKAKKISNDNYEFHYELGNLLGMMGKHDEMIDAFLDLLMISPNYIQTVQNSFNRNLNVTENKARSDLLKQKLLKKVQRHPDVAIYNDLLIWLFLQKKDFASALVQAKALDKRLLENGYRLIDIAQLARSNEDFQTSKDAYNAIILKGKLGDYYRTARMELLQVSLEEMTSKPGYSLEELIELENTYEAAIDELGKNAETALMLKELAHLKGFFLGKSDEAIDLLFEAIEIPGLYDRILAITKLELGDLLLLDGDIWEASLLYSQVELDFKEDLLGHEAKFRNAKISYYTGDFEWAQAQLDVLKASTSKLISNDAIDLSLVITDNFNMDTIVAPMLMFAQADLLAYQNRMDEAIAKMDSIIDLWPGHALTDDILMLKADIYYNKAEYDKAMACYDEVLEFYFHDIYADDALFKLADIHQYILNDAQTAQDMYERILLEYPGSLLVIEARKRFRALRGDTLN